MGLRRWGFHIAGVDSFAAAVLVPINEKRENVHKPTDYLTEVISVLPTKSIEGLSTA